MTLTFEPITLDQAMEYTQWRYDPPYDLYSFTESNPESVVAEMLKKESMIFAVLSDGEMIGTRSFGEDGRVAGGTYDSLYKDTGGGLKPDLTGRGLGETVLRAGLRFGSESLGFSQYRVTVAAFNQRALTVCRRVGFREQSRFLRRSDKTEFAILTLEL